MISSLKKKGWIRVDQILEGKQIVKRRICMNRPLEKPKGSHEQPTWLGNAFYIDTGAFYTGWLTLIEAKAVLRKYANWPRTQIVGNGWRSQAVPDGERIDDTAKGEQHAV